ncbi:hypothetical protein E2562_039539 [Oryza meyeriana var. granulata]|uniref:Uncharacterized protein n=1 Tax=Oryza meyeriana var. granulata TaxID=110450 RepID=A0A6G1ECT9_9ORYZ|nr:hypothetical protein E2562_039539 [Oryza meyeriana var. granulata]
MSLGRWPSGLFAIGPVMPSPPFTGYGSSLHRAINDAAYIAMAHMLHLHVQLASQYPYHPAHPLGEEVHLYLSAEREPNHVLRNLVEYVHSSDRYHRVIGLELRQARGRIAHLERLIEPYVHFILSAV